MSKECSQKATAIKRPFKADRGFCGGPKRCTMKTFPAYPMQCLSCKKFGHMSKCCTKLTRDKVRANKADKVKNMEEDGVQEAKAIHLFHITTETGSQVIEF